MLKDIQGYAKGDRVDVVTVKEGDYWQWKAIAKEGDAPPRVEATKSTGGGGKVIGSNYETAEERARRQVYIVRQSSIASAIQLIDKESIEKAKAVDEVLGIAKRFEDYVFGNSGE